MNQTDLKRWRELADALDFDAGTAQVVVPKLIDEVERLRALLERVRSYAVVDPLGNPDRIALPHAARMFGIERDIDDALGPRLATTIAWLTRPPRVCRACGHAARFNCGAPDCPLERERR